MDEEEQQLILKSAWAKFKFFFAPGILASDGSSAWQLWNFITWFLVISMHLLWDGHPDFVLREQYKKVCMENTSRGRINRSRYEAFRLHGSAVDPGICMSDQYFFISFLNIL